MEGVLNAIHSAVKGVSTVLWDYALIFLLCGTGIYFSFRLKFVQVRKFKKGMKTLFGGFKLKGEKANEKGMSPFQALSTAVAAQVGTGNIAGAATAIASGGPGAIFWMWISAFFGMSTIFAEATLAQTYKTTVEGETVGGPVYYIRAAFKGRFGKILAGCFAVLIVVALGFTGNMVQSNAISSAFQTAFDTPPLAVGIVVAIAAGFVFFGGISRIVAITEKIVPVMAGLYILGSLVVIGVNYRSFFPMLGDIFVGAFNPQAVVGGILGAGVKEAIRYGVMRGLFSNEAGMGSTPHAHALAKVAHPCDQGVTAVIGVFIDTFVVLNMTAFTILSTGVLDGKTDGAPLAQKAFSSVFQGAGGIFIAVCMLFFAFSTIIGWYFFGQVNVKYLFGKKAVKIYSIIVLLFIVAGSVLKLDFVWDLSDACNGLMVIPNLIGVLALSGVVVKQLKEYERLTRDRIPETK